MRPLAHVKVACVPVEVALRVEVVAIQSEGVAMRPSIVATQSEETAIRSQGVTETQACPLQSY
jgi:hypothetical protein